MPLCEKCVAFDPPDRFVNELAETASLRSSEIWCAYIEFRESLPQTKTTNSNVRLAGDPGITEQLWNPVCTFPLGHPNTGKIVVFESIMHRVPSISPIASR